ncbi:WGR domain-containing protein [Lamprobacter modestohalophilus]|uniref:WGR domain-containing protein n=1 Tax=Lamprobacter modestohalophilus TaxID=1064514 RepID=UPI002ADEF871|nr:WGR domain-containing protein [Lamprobacter modestohalophilus]MEA1052393.1 WGR domain-containing protein [Lamprobacter modestohalophilus]
MEPDTEPSAIVYLERHDPDKRMARFYSLHLAPPLFGGCDLVREWGRIGSPGRVRRDPFDTEDDAIEALRSIERNKRRKGYRPWSSYTSAARDGERSDSAYPGSL